MTRVEHLQWCKERALPYVEEGNLESAFISMCSDLSKHPETKDHPAIMLGTGLKMNGNLNTPEQMREFIKGFN